MFTENLALNGNKHRFICSTVPGTPEGKSECKKLTHQLGTSKFGLNSNILITTTSTQIMFLVLAP
jgi:hypothetical protein